MAIPKFTKLTTTACPLNIENVDTDQIIPARFLKAVERKGFGDNLFRDWRYDKAGNKVDSFPLNDPKFGGEILVAAKTSAAVRRANMPRGRFSTTDSGWWYQAFSPIFSATTR